MSSSEGSAEQTRPDWPSVELDSVRRLRVLATAGGHRLFEERVLPGSFDQVWSVAADLEGELPGFISGLRSFSVSPAVPGSDRLSAVATSAIGHREHFDIVLRPGWCLMQSSAVVGGMAAVPDPDGVRFALFGGLRLPGTQVVRQLFPAAVKRKGLVMMDRLEHRVRAKIAAETA
ncbi:hypothetical protein P3T37_003594 [Kitasatospora sp. MAA4]|uniref:hypothetical protein n=1 Tax=Kitasatospora sp. MAA4 TaxID=3035093 RepID=UPI00247491B4|nr:hypothetical protein [Kitasatospora sp. MAA4]MDH6134192.1 hypothetical protein [Kitasatospora sp. MAA4]